MVRRHSRPPSSAAVSVSAGNPPARVVMKRYPQALVDQNVKRITQMTETLFGFWNAFPKAATLTQAQVKEINRAIASLAVIVTEAEIK